jgi:hypothetical protein
MYSARIGENARETLAFSPILSLIRISILCQVNALLLSIYRIITLKHILICTVLRLLHLECGHHFRPVVLFSSIFTQY